MYKIWFRGASHKLKIKSSFQLNDIYSKFTPIKTVMYNFKFGKNDPYSVVAFLNSDSKEQ